MAFTQADLDNIESAIASGLLKAVVAGREVAYQKMSDMLVARDLIKSSLASVQTPAQSSPRFKKANFSEDTSSTNPTGWPWCCR